MKRGILVISHGSREEQWVGLVDEAVAAAAAGLHVPVVSAFLEIVEGRLIQDGIDELERQGVASLFVLPLFVSSGSTHVEEIAQAFGYAPISALRGDLGKFRVSAEVEFGEPIDDDAEIAARLLAGIEPLTQHPAEEALLLVGHGSKEPLFHERWRQGLAQLAERLKRTGGYAEAEYAMLLPDQAAEALGRLQREAPDRPVIVVPVFLSSGYFTRHVIPGRLAGMSYRYSGDALLPGAAVQSWLARQMKRWLQGIGD